MIKMSAWFVKDGVTYTIEADNSSGNTLMEAQAFKLAVEQIYYDTVEPSK